MSDTVQLPKEHYRHLAKYKYDISRYNFQKAFENLYEADDLSKLHKKQRIREGVENDSSTILHKRFYDNFSKMEGLYLSFLREVIKPILNDSFFYQVIPCVRFGLPGTSWLSRFHTDDEYNHSKYEMNINMAITSTYDSCALEIMRDQTTNERIPLTMMPGEFCFIDHINCLHGSPINKTESTLITLDFRLVPEKYAEYAFSNRLSVNTKLAFTKGKYFSCEAL